MFYKRASAAVPLNSKSNSTASRNCCARPSALYLGNRQLQGQDTRKYRRQRE
ncbi:hypothetical protein HanXRQr2_Chr17g0783791 [Helianthus annuus]|uniref:Uncharacterized protein n=1 Tax=Helianthus annuus TaxID=4232 RepID=A0A9K3DFF9_HELAN|nr:hypothetical protein HanXRQr2_Chr17g0783791 [Helianthus annuus]KAJ0431656.1 hypothetical protein HanIR_Chr17g0850741 [Helianthus annuus]